MADPKQRHLVYGLHAVRAVVDRAPERVLELWLADSRDDVRARELRQAAVSIGLRPQMTEPGALSRLAGEAAHQGAVASVRARLGAGA